jgi:C1A family cysteine protease
MKTAQTVLLLCFIGILCNAKLNLPHEWHAWKAIHEVSYETEHEELLRHVVWSSNQKYIDEHNKYADTFGYTLEMNKFGDMTNAEFTDLMMCVQDSKHLNSSLNSKLQDSKFRGRVREYKHPEGVTLPDTVDWRTGGAVTHVKDQLRCGCSYAFAAVGALEGAAALAKDTIVELSEQNVVDCSIPYGNHGCSCGDVNNAYMYVIDNGGVDTDKSYPYVSRVNINVMKLPMYCAFL